MTDTERLDWLQQQTKARCLSVIGNPPTGLQIDQMWCVHLNGIGYAGWCPTIREAIDAARNTVRREAELAAGGGA